MYYFEYGAPLEHQIVIQALGCTTRHWPASLGTRLVKIDQAV